MGHCRFLSLNTQLRLSNCLLFHCLQTQPPKHFNHVLQTRSLRCCLLGCLRRRSPWRLRRWYRQLLQKWRWPYLLLYVTSIFFCISFSNWFLKVTKFSLLVAPPLNRQSKMRTLKLLSLALLVLPANLWVLMMSRNRAGRSIISSL